METVNTTTQDMARSLTLTRTAIEGIQALILLAEGDSQRDGTRDTPTRFLKAFQEMTSGYACDPSGYLQRTFRESESDAMIVVRNIAFSSLCEHHLLPFVGCANVAYIPTEGLIVGLSKIPRLVLGYARRLQVQERLTAQIGTALDAALAPQGVAVQVISQHQCMSCRGVRAASADMVTSYLSGEFRSSASARAEFFSQIAQK